jgi:cell division protein FtsQ
MKLTKKTAKPKAARRPRRWLKLPSPRARKIAAVLAGVGVMAGIGLYFAKAGLPARVQVAVDATEAQALAASAALGLSVQQVLVDGRVETPAADVLHVLDVSRNAPILAFHPAEAKAELEKLPWIKSASVERRLPNVVYVRLVEREPLAMWQRHGQLTLIDRDGVEIPGADLARFNTLPVVVGDGAPQRAAALFALLATEPDLARRVSAAVRVGDRRWNLRLELGADRTIEALLPEENPGAAWTRLADLDRQQHLFDRDITAIDLRFPDRLVVRVHAMPPAPAHLDKRGKKST